MTKLSQLLAIERGYRTTVNDTEAAFDHALARPDVTLSGLQRSYAPRDDDGERLPDETKRVQTVVADQLTMLGATLARLFDLVATKDRSNLQALADVTLPNGEVLLRQVPAVTLLFLESQLAAFIGRLKKLPTLDPVESWHHDPATGVWASEPAQTIRTKKVPRTLVKVEATDRFPAQVDVYPEDVQVGTWRIVKYSGAMSADQVRTLVRRAEDLLEAVKFAREAANAVDVLDLKIGKPIFDYLLES